MLLQRMERTQAMLAHMMLEKDESQSLGLGASSGALGELGTAKGAALVMKGRQRFLKDPEAAWQQLEVRIKEKLNWEPGDNWSAEAVMDRVP